MSRTITLADIDEFEDTEEQFASSVAGSGRQADEDQEIASGTLASAREKYATLLPEKSQQDLLSSTSTMNTNTANTPESWKDEIASRLQNYKARRRRSLGQESLPFSFESTAGNHVFLRPEREPEPEPVYQEPEPAPSYMHSTAAPAFEEAFPQQAEPMEEIPTEAQGSFLEFTEPVAKPAPEPAKLIVFPRPPMMQEPPRDQLAEPVFETPRIVEVPQEVERVAIPLADITLQPEVPEDLCVPHVEPLAELPLRVAPQAQRIAAEILDSLLVLLATGVFTMILARMTPAALALDKKLMMEMGMIPLMFWAIYKYVFLVHSGETPGMRMAHLQLVNFDGELPRTLPRRIRALSMLVSIFPLGLGLLWAFVDPDQLCWHDRISRTYLTAR